MANVHRFSENPAVRRLSKTGASTLGPAPVAEAVALPVTECVSKVLDLAKDRESLGQVEAAHQSSVHTGNHYLLLEEAEELEECLVRAQGLSHSNRSS